MLQNDKILRLRLLATQKSEWSSFRQQNQSREIVRDRHFFGRENMAAQIAEPLFEA